MRLVPYQSDDHAVEVEEEHDKVEAELDEGFFFVHVQFPEYLRCVEEMLVVEDPVSLMLARGTQLVRCSDGERGGMRSSLFRIVGKQRQIQDQSDPVSVDQEERCEEGVDSGFGNDVGV